MLLGGSGCVRSAAGAEHHDRHQRLPRHPIPFSDCHWTIPLNDAIHARARFSASASVRASFSLRLDRARDQPMVPISYEHWLTLEQKGRADNRQFLPRLVITIALTRITFRTSSSSQHSKHRGWSVFAAYRPHRPMACNRIILAHPLRLTRMRDGRTASRPDERPLLLATVTCARRQARLQRPPLTVAQPELVPEAMAREERGGQATERTPSQAHLVRPRQRVDASARHVLAVVDERLAFAEL